MSYVRKTALSPRPNTLRFEKRPVGQQQERDIPTDRQGRMATDNSAYFKDNSGLAAIRAAVSAASATGGTFSLEHLGRESAVTRLMSLLGDISGDKILTVCRDYDSAFTLTMNGSSERNRSGMTALRSELGLALQHGGTLIVRQFLQVSTLQRTPTGGSRRVSWRNIYAFNLGNGRFEPVPAEHLRYADSCESDGPRANRRHHLLFREFRQPHICMAGTGHS